MAAKKPRSRKARAKKRTPKRTGKKSKNKSAKRRSSLRRFAGGLLLFFLFAGALVGAVSFHKLDSQVRHAFEDEGWALPAHIYARPLELYVGRKIDAGVLVSELTGLGYRRTDDLSNAGSFKGSENAISLHTRGFSFADGTEPSAVFGVRFAVSKDDGAIEVSQLLDRHGDTVSILRLEPRLLGSVSEGAHQDRSLLRLVDVPDALIEMLLLTEDKSFYEHGGIDISAILRASFANVKAGGVVQGGSTITQQLVKNLLLTPERSFTRKVKEALMAMALEFRYSKDQILQAYLNEVYLGQSGNRAIHGFGLASQFYFDRPLDELDLHEMSLLVGMVRGPSYYSPRRNPKRAKLRRNRVLNRIADIAKLDPAVVDRYKKLPLGVTERGAAGAGHPAFREYVQRQLRTQYDPSDLEGDGLIVFTTLDPIVQSAAEQALSQGLLEIESAREMKSGELEGAIVVIRVDNGEVLAVVGGRQAKFDGFNRALDARRPIGSLIKPAVFLTALERSNRYTLVSLLEDEPFVVNGPGGQVWQPGNYDGESHGTVTLMSTLSHSYNMATARLGLDVGLDQVADTLVRLGVAQNIPRYPSLLLGSLDLSPIEVAQMYQTIANGGFMAPLKTVSSVVDDGGRSLNRRSSSLNQTVSQEPIHLITKALQDVMQSGTGRRIADRFSPSLGLAGKTGTTDEFRDSWFAGFSGNYVTVVWIGRDDNASTNLSGATGALEIFSRVMSQLSLTPVSDQLPAGVALIMIDRATGLRADEHCDTAFEIPFIRGSEPRDWAPCSRMTASRGRWRIETGGVRRFLEKVFGDSDNNEEREGRITDPKSSKPRSLDDSNR